MEHFKVQNTWQCLRYSAKPQTIPLGTDHTMQYSNAVVLEEVAKMASPLRNDQSDVKTCPHRELQDKHYYKKR